MTTSSAQRQPEQGPLPAILLPGTARPAVPHYLPPAHPALVEQSARAWWLALGCWFAGSLLGQVLHSPAAIAFRYRYNGVEYDRLPPDPLAIMLFGLLAVFLASLVLSMRDGAPWARALLAWLAGPLAVMWCWQAWNCLFTGAFTAGGVAQGLLCLVASCVLPCAVGLMCRREVRSHFRRTE